MFLHYHSNNFFCLLNRVIPFFFIGMGQVFAVSGVYDYTYAKCPKHLRATSSAIVLLGMGNILSINILTTKSFKLFSFRMCFVCFAFLFDKGTTSAGMNEAINFVTENFINDDFGDLNNNNLEYVFLIVLAFVFVHLFLQFF